MKKKVFLAVLSIFVFFFSAVHADVKDGQYQVNVSLLKAYQDDYSMGSGAMLSEATLFVNNGSGTLRLTFVPLETMGFRGYLGEIYVNGVPGSVISTYEEVDSYNDATNGVDAKMKGRSYPRVVDVPVDVNGEIQSCMIYVPVMAEMGMGEQNARLKITYPQGFYVQASEPTPVANEVEPVVEEVVVEETKPIVSEPQTNESEKKIEDNGNKEDVSADKDDSKEEVSNDNGTFYTLPIELWHSVEDKESMGNNSITHTANLWLKDGKMMIYIGCDKMQVSDITASLIDLYYDNGTEFVKADAYSYKVKIDGYDELRPEVFSVPLSTEQDFLSVMLDPKVAPMGDDPIRARLKFNFAEKKEILESEAGLVAIAINSEPKPKHDVSKAEIRMDKGIKIEVPPNTFDKEYAFYANQIRGEKLNQYESAFDSLDTVKVYELSALGDLDAIPYDAKSPINSLRKSYQPNNSIKITIPIEKDVVDLKVYAFDGAEKKELEFEQEGEELRFEYDKFVPFVLVYKKDMEKVCAVYNENNNKEENSKNSENDDEIKKMMKDEEESNENYGLIIFLSLFIILLLVLGVYFSLKYLKASKKELTYAEELKKMGRDKK